MASLEGVTGQVVGMTGEPSDLEQRRRLAVGIRPRSSSVAGSEERLARSGLLARGCGGPDRRFGYDEDDVRAGGRVGADTDAQTEDEEGGDEDTSTEDEEGGDEGTSAEDVDEDTSTAEDEDEDPSTEDADTSTAEDEDDEAAGGVVFDARAPPGRLSLVVSSTDQMGDRRGQQPGRSKSGMGTATGRRGGGGRGVNGELDHLSPSSDIADSDHRRAVVFGPRSGCGGAARGDGRAARARKSVRFTRCRPQVHVFDESAAPIERYGGGAERSSGTRRRTPSGGDKLVSILRRRWSDNRGKGGRRSSDKVDGVRWVSNDPVVDVPRATDDDDDRAVASLSQPKTTRGGRLTVLRTVSRSLPFGWGIRRDSLNERGMSSTFVVGSLAPIADDSAA